MCAMFAVSQVENMSFVEFLDMVSAFSPKVSFSNMTFSTAVTLRINTTCIAYTCTCVHVCEYLESLSQNQWSYSSSAHHFTHSG